MKALEQKVDPLLARFDAIFEIAISDENLDAIKTAVEGVAEAGDLLLALDKGGQGQMRVVCWQDSGQDGCPCEMGRGRGDVQDEGL